jgi:hypothetical protein
MLDMLNGVSMNQNRALLLAYSIAMEAAKADKSKWIGGQFEYFLSYDEDDLIPRFREVEAYLRVYHLTGTVGVRRDRIIVTHLVKEGLVKRRQFVSRAEFFALASIFACLLYLLLRLHILK